MNRLERTEENAQFRPFFFLVVDSYVYSTRSRYCEKTREPCKTAGEQNEKKNANVWRAAKPRIKQFLTVIHLKAALFPPSLAYFVSRRQRRVS
jgi:hypothetical protein